MSVRSLAMGIMAVGLAACDAPRATLSPNFGNSVRHNVAIQTINPNPNETMVPPELDGERAADLMNRYKQGQIKPPPSFEPPATTLSSGN